MHSEDNLDTPAVKASDAETDPSKRSSADSKEQTAPTRRAFLTDALLLSAGLGSAAAAGQNRSPAAGPLPSGNKPPTGLTKELTKRKPLVPSNTFTNLHRLPDVAIVFTEEGQQTLKTSPAGTWQGAGIEIETTPTRDGLQITLAAPNTAVKRLLFRWHARQDGIRLFLGDHWERGYGDLEWRAAVPERVMPWYVLAFDGAVTHGYGVRTGCNALCFWQADSDGLTLWADVKSGGVGVHLGERKLEVCTVVSRAGQPNETAWKAHHAFCKVMCPTPRLPAHPVYGSNDWYWAYGNNTAGQILYDCQKLVLASTNGGNAPYTVIDDGWQPSGGGIWDRGNERFLAGNRSMAEVALRIREIGARSGLWIRPLSGNQTGLPHEWHLSRDGSLLDPTMPEVLHKVSDDIARIREWGFNLIKHDYTTYDILGRWGFQMGPQPSADGWKFARQNKTNAEIILELYQTIRSAAGGSVIIGCNTVSHLTAGIFELCRIGDDTSGRDWERTRKMGVNSLAFRSAQHNAFYAADADCVGITKEVPWEQNRQWLDLLARSGTPMFLSIKQSDSGPAQQKAIRDALALAAESHPAAEPLDWMQTNCPRKWRLIGETVEYDWFLPQGASPFNV